MVHKKDACMHMCMDYHVLNVLTIKEKYPLPKIDELFDQLLGACYFTNFLVCIKMHDLSKMAFR